MCREFTIQEHVDLQRFIYLWKEKSLTAWSILPTAKKIFSSSWGRPGFCFSSNETKEKFQHSLASLEVSFWLFIQYQAILELTRAKNLIHENIHDTCDLLCKVSFTSTTTGHANCHYRACKLLNDHSLSHMLNEQHNTCLWTRLYWCTS